MKDEASKNNYCASNYDDVVQFTQCKDSDDFCTVCCEKEFGDMHLDHRKECIKEVCKANGNTPNGKEHGYEDGNGKWVWLNKLD